MEFWFQTFPYFPWILWKNGTFQLSTFLDKIKEKQSVCFYCYSQIWISNEKKIHLLIKKQPRKDWTNFSWKKILLHDKKSQTKQIYVDNENAKELYYFFCLFVFSFAFRDKSHKVFVCLLSDTEASNVDRSLVWVSSKWWHFWNFFLEKKVTFCDFYRSKCSLTGA